MNRNLQVVGKDERIREYILPVRIVSTEGRVEFAERLLEARELQILLQEDRLCAVHGKASLIFDFGKEIHGGLRVLTHGCEGNPAVRVRFGESVSECCAELGERGASNDHSLRDLTVRLTMLSDMEFGASGFRFVRIDTLEEGTISLKSVLATFIHRDLHPVGKFSCDDRRWNEIYDTAAYTLELNMQHHLWDGIKRDRLVWMGDIHPETKGIIALFGADPCVPEALDLLRERTPLPNFMNGMAAYSLWYLVILADYYLQNGDEALVRRQADYVRGLVKLFTDFVGEDGSLGLDEFFLDWQSYRREGAEAGVTALFAIAMKKTKLLLSVLGESDPAIDEALGRLKRDLPDGNQKQVIAFRALAGQVDAREAADRLAAGGAKGFSTFMSYYIAKAMFEGGRKQEAVDYMREYYGAMLDRGATTFWEDFNVDWLEGSSRIDELPKAGEKDLHGDFGAFCYVGFRHSLCHGWSCGPLQFLTEYVLGVRVVEPGCRAVEIRPYLGTFKQVSGCYPTPYGVIRIEHRMENGKLVSDIAAPEGVQIRRV